MYSNKYEPLLNLALNVDEKERELSENLSVGFNSNKETWTVAIRYNGNIEYLKEHKIEIIYLEGGFAILLVPDIMINKLFEFDEIIYAELPKKMFYSVVNNISETCISAVKNSESYNSLNGRGVICGIIDSGIDIFHRVFRNADGSTRIVEIWDQTIEGNPPDGYKFGSIYSREYINRAINLEESVIPAKDLSGHGTHVAGIMAGNFSNNLEGDLGIATKSDIAVVKLGTASNNFPTTVELMLGINYLYQVAVNNNKPISINISIGNSYGSHDGNSLLESYINYISNIWKMSICVGAGNEGNENGHYREIFTSDSINRISFSIGEYEKNISLQIWKNYVDNMSFDVVLPGEELRYRIPQNTGSYEVRFRENRLLIYVGEPSPYSIYQEIYIDIIPENMYITSGVWSINVYTENVVEGQIDVWMNDGALLNSETGFLNPSPETTITIPSTASNVISVGAYNSSIDAVSDFSGRGYLRNLDRIKPELVAPGVDILSASVGGGYTRKTGTSMSCPFVSGSAALLMQWGIINGNDPYMYGEKIKANLMKGARNINIKQSTPNPTVGYGALCLKNSIPN